MPRPSPARWTRNALLRRGLLGAGLLFVGLTAAQGQTVFFSNLGQTTNGDGGPYYQTSGGSHIASAQSFTTGTAATTLDRITLSILAVNGGTFALALYSDDSAAPGTLLETLTGASAPASGNVSYTSGASTALNANTTYWWVATVTNAAEALVAINLVTGTTGTTVTDGWSISDAYSSTQTGNSFGGWSSYGGRSLAFSVSATSAVPEPAASGALAGLAILGFAALRRRRPMPAPTGLAAR